MKIGIVNASTRVSDADARAMTSAIAVQVRRDYAPAWGRHAPTVTFHPNRAEVHPSAFLVVILDDPDAADALGYHDEEGDRPYGKVFAAPVLDGGGTVLGSADSVSGVLSHEVLELAGDPVVNRWADTRKAGEQTAEELCDAVQDGGYPIPVGGKDVFVSNFLLPAWFDREAPDGTRVDFLGTLKAPFTRTAGGYMIVRTAGGERQVFGERAPHRPAHPTSRSTRRAA